MLKPEKEKMAPNFLPETQQFSLWHQPFLSIFYVLGYSCKVYCGSICPSFVVSPLWDEGPTSLFCSLGYEFRVGSAVALPLPLGSGSSMSLLPLVCNLTCGLEVWGVSSQSGCFQGSRASQRKDGCPAVSSG